MNNQQIALSLVAQLDRGNIEAEVSQLASSMARSIEAAFESLGDKIAQTIIKGGMTGMQELGRSIQTGTFQPNMLPGPTANNIGVDSGKEVQALKEQLTALKEQIAKVNTTGSSQEVGAPLLNPIPRRGNEVQFGSTLDVAVQQARAVSSIRDSGSNIEISPEQKTLFENAKRMIDEGLSQNIQALAQNVKDLNDGIKSESEVQKESRRIAETSSALRGAKGLIEGAMPEESTGMSLGQKAQLAGAVMGVTRMIGMAPAALRGGEAASAEYSNLSSRQLMRGNIEEMIATENIGGQGAATGRAQKEETIKTAAEIGIAVAAAIAAPFSGGMSLAVGGAALGIGAKGAMDVMNFRQNTGANVQQQIADEMGKSAEYMQISSVGRAQSLQAFNTARGLGAPELSGFLQGGSAIGYGASVGLGANDVNQTLGTLGRAGGVYSGKTPFLEGMGSQVNDLLNLQAQGVASAPEMATGLMRNSSNQTVEGFREAVEKTKDMWTDIISTGMDKTAGIRMMGEAAQQIANGGLGAGSQTMASTERAAMTASAMGLTGEAGVGFVNQAQNAILDKTKGGSGIMATAGFAAARGTKSEIKKKLGLNIDEITLQQFGADEEGLEALFHAQKPNAVMSDKDRQAMKEITRNDQQRRMQGASRVQRLMGDNDSNFAGGAAMANAQNMAQAVLSHGVTRNGQNQIMPPDRLPGQAKFDPNAVPGGGMQKVLSEQQALMITNGLSTLGTNLDIINKAFASLATRVQGIMTQSNSGGGASNGVPSFIQSARASVAHAIGMPETMRRNR